MGRLDTVMDVPAAAISANDSFFFSVVAFDIMLNNLYNASFLANVCIDMISEVQDLAGNIVYMLNVNNSKQEWTVHDDMLWIH